MILGSHEQDKALKKAYWRSKIRTNNGFITIGDIEKICGLTSDRCVPPELRDYLDMEKTRIEHGIPKESPNYYLNSKGKRFFANRHIKWLKFLVPIAATIVIALIGKLL